MGTVAGQSKQQKSAVDKRLAEIMSQLETPATPENEAPLLKTALRVTKLESNAPTCWRSLAHHASPQVRDVPLPQLWRWPHHPQQFGPEALDARRKLLLELEQAGKFQINDPELRNSL